VDPTLNRTLIRTTA